MAGAASAADRARGWLRGGAGAAPGRCEKAGSDEAAHVLEAELQAARALMEELLAENERLQSRKPSALVEDLVAENDRLRRQRPYPLRTAAGCQRLQNASAPFCCVSCQRQPNRAGKVAHTEFCEDRHLRGK